MPQTAKIWSPTFGQFFIYCLAGWPGGQFGLADGQGPDWPGRPSLPLVSPNTFYGAQHFDSDNGVETSWSSMSFRWVTNRVDFTKIIMVVVVVNRLSYSTISAERLGPSAGESWVAGWQLLGWGVAQSRKIGDHPGAIGNSTRNPTYGAKWCQKLRSSEEGPAPESVRANHKPILVG